MPAYRFLYEKRRITGLASPEAINFVGDAEEQPNERLGDRPELRRKMSGRLFDVARSSARIKGGEIAGDRGRARQGGKKMNGQPPQNPRHQGMDYGETEDVHVTHAAVVREKVEPLIGREPLSLWLIAVYGLAVFFGGAYLGRYSGNFSGDGLDYLGGAPRVATKAGAAGTGAEQTAELTPAEKGKRFSPPTAPPAIKPMASVLLANIRRSPVRKS